MKICRIFIVVAAFAVTSCDPALSESNNDQGKEVPKELEELYSAAFSCWRDSRHAPIEHSEHCVIVAEQYIERIREDCLESHSVECMEHDVWLGAIDGFYSDAIIQSLIRFGVPQWVKENSDKEPFPEHLYHDGELLRSQFEECLKSEEDELAKSGLQPATMIINRPLMSGQRCFRRGYPDFTTAPLVTS